MCVFFFFFYYFFFSSVLDKGQVKHYKLRKLDSGGYYVSRSKSFETLKELVEHYSNTEDGLCVRLREPCKKVRNNFTYRLQYCMYSNKKYINRKHNIQQLKL